MRYKAILLLVSILALATSVKAQETYTVNDTIYNPKVVFSGHHPKYEIAGIKVTGADNYEDYIIIGYSGLSIGQRVEIPGEDIKNAAKRFWRQGLFSKVQIKVEKVYGDKAWLEFDLQQQPRISQVNYLGMKGGEKKDVIERLGLTPGNQMTPNIADRIKIIVQKYFADKGFDKATVEVIQKEAVSVGIGMASPERIDEINILQATYEAMRQAVANLSVKPSLLLNDAVTIPGMDMKQVPIIKGDAKSISIGAASIMAKVYRDRMMEEYDHIFPGYDFASNKGYGSKEHIEAIHRQGPCPIHRRSFLKNICGEQI